MNRELFHFLLETIQELHPERAIAFTPNDKCWGFNKGNAWRPVTEGGAVIVENGRCGARLPDRVQVPHDFLYAKVRFIHRPTPENAPHEALRANNPLRQDRELKKQHVRGFPELSGRA